MAPQTLSGSRQPSKEKPVNEEPSSEEEEEEEESEDDEGSESHSSEEEKDKYKNDFSGETGQDEDEDLKPSKSKIDSKSVNQEIGSDSDSDLGSPSNYKLQPVSRVSKSSSKRTHDDEPARNSKRLKSEEGKSVGSSTSTPGGCITRLWSDKDEVTVLNGMIEFKNNADIGAFHNFIKGKLEADFSKDQLNSKIRRMKKRFLNAVKKSENGEDPVFSKPHEDKAFELSKRIWGGSVGIKGENGIKDEKEVFKADKVELDEKEIVKDEKDGEEGIFSGSKYPYLSRSFENLMSSMPSLEMSKSGMSFALKRLSSSSKAEELDEKWRVLIMEELELNHKKLTLMKEQMNTAFDFGE